MSQFGEYKFLVKVLSSNLYVGRLNRANVATALCKSYVRPHCSRDCSKWVGHGLLKMQYIISALQIYLILFAAMLATNSELNPSEKLQMLHCKNRHLTQCLS